MSPPPTKPLVGCSPNLAESVSIVVHIGILIRLDLFCRFTSKAFWTRSTKPVRSSPKHHFWFSEVGMKHQYGADYMVPVGCFLRIFSHLTILSIQLYLGHASTFKSNQTVEPNFMFDRIWSCHILNRTYPQIDRSAAIVKIMMIKSERSFLIELNLHINYVSNDGQIS